MSRNTRDKCKDNGDLAEDARALLAATAHMTGPRMERARKRLALALKHENDAGPDLQDAPGDDPSDYGEKICDCITDALNHGKDICEKVRDDVVHRAQAADRTLRENPYRNIGIALGIGALVGCIVSARHSKK